MASAIVLHFAGTNPVAGQPTQKRLSFVVEYVGVDVPGDYNEQTLEVVYTIGDTIATLATNMRTVIQNYATNQGYTVANGASFIPTYQTI